MFKQHIEQHVLHITDIVITQTWLNNVKRKHFLASRKILKTNTYPYTKASTIPTCMHSKNVVQLFAVGKYLLPTNISNISDSY